MNAKVKALPKDFWNKHPKPIIALAPMDGYTDSPFRRMIKRINPDVVTFTEFTSAEGLSYGAKRLQQRIAFEQEEQPVFAQIFGKSPRDFTRAAKLCEKMGHSGVDINFGCPSKKVVKSEHGVAVRKKPQLAYDLVAAVADAVDLPVSVKTRLGWSDSDDLIEFGELMQKAGANLITIHGRTYSEPYGVPARFEPIYRLKEAIDIPVIGNGGIQDIEDGMSKLRNLDGLMIGQAAIANFWALSKTGTPDFATRAAGMKLFAQLLCQSKGEERGCKEIRKYLVKFIKAIPDAARYRSEVVTVSSLAAIESVLDTLGTLEFDAQPPRPWYA